MSDKIYFAYNKELCKRTGLRLVGKGGAMMGDVQKVNADYACFEKLTVEQARKLYVQVIEGYLCRYNQNEAIRPYLHNFPFTVVNLDVRIAFKERTNELVGQGFVVRILTDLKGNIIYLAYDHAAKAFIDLCKEPYEVAREIVLSETVPN